MCVNWMVSFCKVWGWVKKVFDLLMLMDQHNFYKEKHFYWVFGTTLYVIIPVPYSFLIKLPHILHSVRGQSLGENHLSWLTEDEILQSKDELPGCDMKNDIADLKDLIVSVKEELNEMKTGFIKEVNDKLPVCDRKNDIADLKDLMVSIRKELNEMKTEFMEEIKAMWKDTKEEKPSKKVSTTKNKCMS